MPMPSKGACLRIAISLGLLVVYLVFLVDLRDAWAHLRECHWGYLGLLAVWITLDRLMMSYKWRLLVHSRGLDLSHFEALKAYYQSTFAGSFLPSTLGADAIRVALLATPTRPSAEIAASILMERALGFLAAALAAGAGLLLLAYQVQGVPPSVIHWSAGLLAFSVAAVLLSLSAWSARLAQALTKIMERKGRVLSWGATFINTYMAYRQHGRTLAAFLLLSLLEQSAPAVATWLTALALGIHLSLLQAVAVTPLAMLLTRIPLSFSGFGVIEGLYMAFFALVGVSATDSFLLGLVGNLSVIVATLPGALLYAFSGLR